MIDTSPEFEQRYRDMLMARTPEERITMGARMFDTARAMVLASFPSDLSFEERRRRLFERLYGDDIPPDQRPVALRPR
jgi:hypothetical protein